MEVAGNEEELLVGTAKVTRPTLFVPAKVCIDQRRILYTQTRVGVAALQKHDMFGRR